MDQHIIYFDVCCLNRPFDDQTQERIKLESEAVLSILSGCEVGKWALLNSEVIDFEVSLISDFERRLKIMSLLTLASQKIVLNDKIKLRAKQLEQINITSYDALHLACAEEYATVFLTTDDKLLRRALKNAGKIQIEVQNPVIWLMEVTKSESTNNEP